MIALLPIMFAAGVVVGIAWRKPAAENVPDFLTPPSVRKVPEVLAADRAENVPEVHNAHSAQNEGMPPSPTKSTSVRKVCGALTRSGKPCRRDTKCRWHRQPTAEEQRKVEAKVAELPPVPENYPRGKCPHCGAASSSIQVQRVLGPEGQLIELRCMVCGRAELEL